MRTKVRAALNAIDTILAERNQDSVDLANILSALRGPDSGNDAVKAATTARIRDIAFPKASKPASLYGNFMPRIGWLTIPGSVDESMVDVSGHFNAHVGFAVKAINRMDEPTNA